MDIAKYYVCSLDVSDIQITNGLYVSARDKFNILRIMNWHLCQKDNFDDRVYICIRHSANKLLFECVSDRQQCHFNKKRSCVKTKCNLIWNKKQMASNKDIVANQLIHGFHWRKLFFIKRRWQFWYVSALFSLCINNFLYNNLFLFFSFVG